MIIFKKITALRPEFPDDASEKDILFDFIHEFEAKNEKDACPNIAFDKAVLNAAELKGQNVIAAIQDIINGALDDFKKKFEDLISSWIELFLNNNEALIQRREILEVLSELISSTDLRLNAMEYNIKRDITRIKQIKEEVGGVK